MQFSTVSAGLGNLLLCPLRCLGLVGKNLGWQYVLQQTFKAVPQQPGPLCIGSYDEGDCAQAGVWWALRVALTGLHVDGLVEDKGVMQHIDDCPGTRFL